MTPFETDSAARRAIIRAMVAGVRDPQRRLGDPLGSPEHYARTRLSLLDLLPEPEALNPEQREYARVMRCPPGRSPQSRRRAGANGHVDDHNPFAAQGGLPTPRRALSPAERALMPYVLAGLSTRQIAAARGCSVINVKKHLARIYDALSVETRYEAIVMGQSLGISAATPDARDGRDAA